MERMSAFEFFSKLTFNPRRFFEENYRRRQTPYFGLVFVLFGLYCGIDRIDDRLTKAGFAALDGRPRQLQQWTQLCPSWTAYAAWVVGVGTLAAAIYYALGAWWYNVRIGFAGGRKDADDAKFLYLYSSALPALLAVVIRLTTFPRYPDPIVEATADGETIDVVFFGFLIAGLLWSFYVSYRGVRVVTGVRPLAGKFWFLFLPVAFVGLALAAIILAMFAALGGA